MLTLNTLLRLVRQYFFKPKTLLEVDGGLPPFIFTEIYRCGKIGKIALESFRAFHPGLTVHVFGTPQDFQQLSPDPKIIFHDLTAEPQILNNFNHGHRGTASLWAKVILEQPEQYVIHFDSDVVFRGPAVNRVIQALQAGHHLAGPRRNYRNNPNHRDDVRDLPDVTQTYCFGFDRSKIFRWDRTSLSMMCQGVWNPSRHPIIDFFDPVMFEIINNGGKVAFMHEDRFGGCLPDGSRNNKYTELNQMIDFGDEVVHFAAVGSGMNFFEHPDAIRGNVPETYVKYAKEKYAVYCKIFYSQELPISYRPEKYHAIFGVERWYQPPKE